MYKKKIISCFEQFCLMKSFLKKICLLLIVYLITNSNILAQTIKISVSNIQEENYNKLIDMIKGDFLLNKNNDFIITIEETFKSAKNNESTNYFESLKKYNEEYNKLNSEQKNIFLSYILKLTPPELVGNPVAPGSCKVSCPLSSCEIQCEQGQKPECKCEGLWASCSCK